MFRVATFAVLGLAPLLLAAGNAAGDIAPPSSVAERMGRTTVTVVARVTAQEDKTVKTVSHWGNTPAEYQVFVLKVEQNLHGPKGLTHLKVGLIPPRGPRRFPTSELKPGMEVLLFLVSHPKENFYVIQGFYDSVPSTVPTFKKDVELAQRCSKLLADPVAGLKAKDATDRALTTALLIVRYRTGPSAGKTEEIPAEQSRLILKNLAELDWARPNPVLDWSLSPQTLFSRLGVTEKDGWKAPTDFRKFAEEARRWLTANADKYRVRRLVP